MLSQQLISSGASLRVTLAANTAEASHSYTTTETASNKEGKTVASKQLFCSQKSGLSKVLFYGADPTQVLKTELYNSRGQLIYSRVRLPKGTENEQQNYYDAHHRLSQTAILTGKTGALVSRTYIYSQEGLLGFTKVRSSGKQARYTFTSSLGPRVLTGVVSDNNAAFELTDQKQHAVTNYIISKGKLTSKSIYRYSKMGTLIFREKSQLRLGSAVRTVFSLSGKMLSQQHLKGKRIVSSLVKKYSSAGQLLQETFTSTTSVITKKVYVYKSLRAKRPIETRSYRNGVLVQTEKSIKSGAKTVLVRFSGVALRLYYNAKGKLVQKKKVPLPQTEGKSPPPEGKSAA